MSDKEKKKSRDEKKEKRAAAPSAGVPGFASLRDEVERLFDAFEPGAWPWRGGQPFGDKTVGAPAPAVDLADRGDAYEITAELPGMTEKEVEVKLANGVLTIKGEKREESEETKKDYYISERRYGAFQRNFRVPDGVDADRIAAHVSDGVLTVTLPKTAGAEPEGRTIAITRK